MSIERTQVERPFTKPAFVMMSGLEGNTDALAARRASLDAVYDHGSAGINEVDIASGQFLHVNRRYCEITGRSEAELLGGKPADVVHPDDSAKAREGWRTAVLATGNWDTEIRYLQPNGRVIWARTTVAVCARDPDGRPLRVVGIVQDITPSKNAEHLLRLLSLQVGRVGSFRQDYRSDLCDISPELCEMYGLESGHTMCGLDDWFHYMLPDDRDKQRAALERALADRDQDGVNEFAMRRPSDGALRHFEMRVRYEYDGLGEPLASTGVVIDVTERVEAQKRIAHLAHHDALTDLPNRTLFGIKLDEALTRAKRGESFALLCIDLDRFKDVNDTLGHAVGDALLCAVSARLAGALRGEDTLARLGGDEFMVIQSNLCEPRDATVLAQRIIELLAEPFDVHGHQLSVGSSVGIAVAPTDGLDPDHLLKAADIALYRAKEDGRGKWRFFEAEMDARLRERRALETDLRRALAAGEFELFYQPIINVRTRRVSGLEALIRWRHPQRGLVPPDAFIPLAEEAGLIVPIGEWVVRQACQQAVSWQGKPKIAVNLSPAQFASRGLVDAVADALRCSDLDPARLELEITETVLLRDTEATLQVLHRLKSLGVRIAMDDFGTGYSSLSYLQRFPFDKIKIDCCFTSQLDHSRQSNAIVRAVTGLCAGLGMTTTAEGVETEEQFGALLRKGCEEAQGYLFSRPKPAHEIPAILEAIGSVPDVVPA